VGISRLAGSISALFRGINYMGGLGWMRSSWGLWGKEEGVGQDLEQARSG
jgi:hypothetical protein